VTTKDLGQSAVGITSVEVTIAIRRHVEEAAGVYCHSGKPSVALEDELRYAIFHGCRPESAVPASGYD
jgi:hypothetical protein